MRTIDWLWMSLAMLVATVGCNGENGASLGLRSEPIVYGEDNRTELFDVEDGLLREAVAQSIVVFVQKGWVREQSGTVQLQAPSQAELQGVCPDEPFAEQPAAALCTGVLVDWDLVLTASHCVHAFALRELVVLFGYFYSSPEQLAVEPEDVYALAEVLVDERTVRNGRVDLDYAWVRLDRPVHAPHRPLAIRMGNGGLMPGTPVVSAGASGGLPIKVDREATIQKISAGEQSNFTADTDTARGGSGGAALDAELALLGVLFAGGDDFVPGADCLRTHYAAPDEADERFVVAARALSGLCEKKPEASSLCRSSCGDPCRALARSTAGAGCALGGANGSAGFTWLALLAVVRWRWRRARDVILRCSG